MTRRMICRRRSSSNCAKAHRASRPAARTINLHSGENRCADRRLSIPDLSWRDVSPTNRLTCGSMMEMDDTQHWEKPRLRQIESYRIIRRWIVCYFKCYCHLIATALFYTRIVSLKIVVLKRCTLLNILILKYIKEFLSRLFTLLFFKIEKYIHIYSKYIII